MDTLDQMPVNEVIKIYYEKHDAIRRCDMDKLIQLKNIAPEIFDKKKDDQIRDMIEYIKWFQSTPRYKELVKMDMKNKFTIIKH